MKMITLLKKMKSRTLIAIGLSLCVATAFSIFYFTGNAIADDLDLEYFGCIYYLGQWICY